MRRTHPASASAEEALLAKTRGWCASVERAIAIVEQALRQSGARQLTATNS